jgi:hypothetical protein
VLVTWQTNCDSSRLFLFDFKVCALPYFSDIGREGFFVPIFYKMIVYLYVLLTHKSVEAANFKP